MNGADFRTAHPMWFAAAMVFIACVCTAFMMALPVMVGLFVEHWHLAESQSAWIANAETAGNAVGAVLVGFVLSRQSARTVGVVAVLGLAVGTLFMATAPGLAGLIAARGVAGIGAGVATGLAMRALSFMNHAARWLSVAVFMQSATAALLLAVLPMLGTPERALAALAVVSAMCLPLMLLFGRSPVLEAHAAGDAGRPVQRVGIYLVLLSLFGLYGGVGVVWTFVERLGVSAQLSPELVGRILGTGNLVSLLSCLAVPFFVERGFRYSATVASLLLCAASAAVLAMPLSVTSFAVASTLFQLAWNAATILAFVNLPLYDPVGRHIPLSPVFFGAGAIAGTSIGGPLMDAGAANLAFATGAGWCLAALLVYLPSRWVGKARRQATLSPGAA